MTEKIKDKASTHPIKGGWGRCRKKINREQVKRRTNGGNASAMDWWG